MARGSGAPRESFEDMASHAGHRDDAAPAWARGGNRRLRSAGWLGPGAGGTPAGGSAWRGWPLGTPAVPGGESLGAGGSLPAVWPGARRPTTVRRSVWRVERSWRRCNPSRRRGRALEWFGDDGVGGVEDGGDQRGEVEVALVGGAHDAGEHLLGVGAVPGAIAAADLAGDDGGPNGLFGAPVGGVDRRVPTES